MNNKTICMFEFMIQYFCGKIFDIFLFNFYNLIDFCNEKMLVGNGFVLRTLITQLIFCDRDR